MNYLKLIIVILVIFFKTGNVLSENNIFNVNNIELTKKPNISNNDLADQAINKGFKMASGDIINWINSDDIVADGALNNIGRFFRDN